MERGNLSALMKKESERTEGFDVEPAFYGGTFTGLSEKDRTGILDQAHKYFPDSFFRISTRPDLIDPEITDYLYAKYVRTVELGVQSLDDKVLVKTRRGYPASVVKQAVKDLKQAGMKTGIQLMPGLPEENRKSWYSTVRQTLDLQPDFVRIYPVVVFKNTELDWLKEKGEYEALTLLEGIERAAYALMVFRAAGIRVIRTGLRSLPDEDVITGGAYHAQFRSMVETYIMRLNLIRILSKKDKNIKLMISVSPGLRGYLSGFRSSNLSLLDSMKYKKISISENTGLSKSELEINETRHRIYGLDPDLDPVFQPNKKDKE